MSSPKAQPPRPVGKVPRPTPPKYHVDRDKTPIPGTYLDHGERRGGEPRQTRPPSLPPALKLGPLTYSAEKDAQRHADESRTRTYSAEEVEALVQREARARGQSAKMAAARDLETHEKRDARMLWVWGAAITGGMAFITTIASLVVNYVGGRHELSAIAASTKAVQESNERQEERLSNIEKTLKDVADQGIKGRMELRAQIAAKQNIPSAKQDASQRFASTFKREMGH